MNYLALEQPGPDLIYIRRGQQSAIFETIIPDVKENPTNMK